MAEFAVICVMLGSLGTNIFLAWVVRELLRRNLQQAIVAAPLPLVEKTVLLDKTADQVAERAHDKPRQPDIVPMMG